MGYTKKLIHVQLKIIEVHVAKQGPIEWKKNLEGNLHSKHEPIKWR